jgi:hypothetical protein
MKKYLVTEEFINNVCELMKWSTPNQGDMPHRIIDALNFLYDYIDYKLIIESDELSEENK